MLISGAGSSCHQARNIGGARWVFMGGTPCPVSHRGVVSALVRVETVSTQLPRHLRVALTVWDGGHRRMCLPQEQGWEHRSCKIWEDPM